MGDQSLVVSCPCYKISYNLVLFVSGIGIALCYGTSTIAIGQYFDMHHLPTAYSATLMGANIGRVVFPFAYLILLKSYGIYGTYLILSAVVLHSVACGSILRPISTNANGTRDQTSIIPAVADVGRTMRQAIGYALISMKRALLERRKENVEQTQRLLSPNTKFSIYSASMDDIATLSGNINTCMIDQRATTTDDRREMHGRTTSLTAIPPGLYPKDGPFLLNKRRDASRGKCAINTNLESSDYQDRGWRRADQGHRPTDEDGGYSVADQGSAYRWAKQESGCHPTDQDSGNRLTDDTGYRLADQSSEYHATDRDREYHFEDQDSGYITADQDSGYRSADQDGPYHLFFLVETDDDDETCPDWNLVTKVNKNTETLIKNMTGIFKYPASGGGVIRSNDINAQTHNEIDSENDDTKNKFIKTNKLVLMSILIKSLNSVGTTSQFAFFPLRVNELGISLDRAAILIATTALCQMASKPLFSMVAATGVLKKQYMVVFSSTVVAILTICVPMYTSFAMLLIFASTIGVFGGSFSSSAAVLLAEHVGPEHLPQALAIDVFWRDVILASAQTFLGK